MNEPVARQHRDSQTPPAPPPQIPQKPKAVVRHYRSIDSAPPAYAVKRPPSAVNGALLIFVALSSLTLLLGTVQARAWGDHARDLVFATADGQAAAIPVRAFLLVMVTSVAWSLDTNFWRRLAVHLELTGVLILVCAVVDFSAYLGYHVGLFYPQIVGQQLASSLAAMVLLPFTVMRHARLPRPARLRPAGRMRWHAWVRLAVPLAVAFVAAAWIEDRMPVPVAWMREWALMGGVGPGIFLVQQLFGILAAGIGLVMIRRSRRARFAPPLAVIIPAHNEAHDITATIEAVDRAAARYAETVHIYVIDNASTDDTADVAQTAIAACAHSTGEVHECAVPGKAVALNYGLSVIREEFVVRIDADTVIGENCLDVTLRHFTDAKVAAVGGMPRPERIRTFFDRVRLVEVLVKHGFFQVAMMGYDGIIGEPGMFVVYRRRVVEEVGGIVQGMNGEDTDICMRMSSQGYLSLVDPTAVYFSETPQSWAHLREQRTRWFRSIYHIAAHNRHAILSRSSMAGAVMLPFQLANAARRAMMLPLLLFGLLIFGLFRESFPGLHPERLLAVFLGLPLLVALGVCLVRQPRAVLYLPEYLVFRIVRSYFTLAAVLSLVFPPLHPRQALRERRRTRRRPRHRRNRATPADRSSSAASPDIAATS
ncbi:glycosyltransferase [Mycolicibacterium monacense]|uniref:Glucosaminyltransferase n=1 Tax=Mycolicibacterium monacense TaxID=85693 RepID=A0AAD1N0B8_MYCMB|nr:glycosyltransferase family 2 protein [Mycolicibacterium monacense]MDA4100819.1 glycosyl transferase [Mycolicibacterium monacense DSM 44395]ORB22050.1 glycosyl transferase [Mycolicibacterium monacense DSM 44395]QHP88297.1 glycosyltransferase family 2 protein [Mycolicibacterium monacense DSM 44395]BBZ64313.1 glucosaminyltransferase [Mycolicibacterium monacense]